MIDHASIEDRREMRSVIKKVYHKFFKHKSWGKNDHTRENVINYAKKIVSEPMTALNAVRISEIISGTDVLPREERAAVMKEILSGMTVEKFEALQSQLPKADVKRFKETMPLMEPLVRFRKKMVPKTMSLSDFGVGMIKGAEKIRFGEHGVYIDSVGYPTAGIGHLIIPRKGKFKNIKEYKKKHPSQYKEWKDKVSTKEKAIKLFNEDTKGPIKAVQNKITQPLTQLQFDSLVDFTYNLGGGALGRSHLKEFINKGVMKGPKLKSAFLEWSKVDKDTKLERVSRGLVKRRLSEYYAFASGVHYPISHLDKEVKKICKIKKCMKVRHGKLVKDY